MEKRIPCSIVVQVPFLWILGKLLSPQVQKALIEVYQRAFLRSPNEWKLSYSEHCAKYQSTQHRNRKTKEETPHVEQRRDPWPYQWRFTPKPSAEFTQTHMVPTYPYLYPQSFLAFSPSDIQQSIWWISQSRCSPFKWMLLLFLQNSSLKGSLWPRGLNS